jgi:hypothetical protein
VGPSLEISIVKWTNARGGVKGVPRSDGAVNEGLTNDVVVVKGPMGQGGVVTGTEQVAKGVMQVHFGFL